MTDSTRNYGCDIKILTELHKQFKYALATKRCVFFFRMDIRFPARYPIDSSNQLISKFNSDFMKQLSRKGLSPQYVMVREQLSEPHQHYHAIVLLDGKRTQNIYYHIQDAERIWRNKLGIEHGNGLVHNCTNDSTGHKQNNGIMITGNDTIDDCFFWSSYLAKEYSKYTSYMGFRELFSSRTPTVI